MNAWISAFNLSFGGVTTFPKSADIREAARITPVDRLLIETDSPYLAPVPHRGKRNEPALRSTHRKIIAEIQGFRLPEHRQPDDCKLRAAVSRTRRRNPTGSTAATLRVSASD